jgi:hypothetical protein
VGWSPWRLKPELNLTVKRPYDELEIPRSDRRYRTTKRLHHLAGMIADDMGGVGIIEAALAKEVAAIVVTLEEIEAKASRGEKIDNNARSRLLRDLHKTATLMKRWKRR